MPRDLIEAVTSVRFRFTTEDQLQRGIAAVLTDRGIPFEREVRLSKSDRVDFLVRGTVAVEVKIDGAWSDLLRQVGRYAECERVSDIVVVSNRARLLGFPSVLHGKPVHVVSLLADGLL